MPDTTLTEAERRPSIDGEMWVSLVEVTGRGAGATAVRQAVARLHQRGVLRRHGIEYRDGRVRLGGNAHDPTRASGVPWIASEPDAE